jgi:hypothetical protein
MAASGHARKNSGGAYRVRFTPKERTSSGHAGSAAWGHEETHAPQQRWQKFSTSFVDIQPFGIIYSLSFLANSLPTTCWTAKCAISGNSPLRFNSP